MASLAQAIHLNPALTEPRVTQIRVAMRQNQNGAACDLAEKLLEIDRSDAKIIAVAAKAFTKAKSFSKAADEWNIFGRHVSKEAQPLIDAASLYMMSGAYDQARDCASLAGQREPNNAQSLAILATALDALNDLPEFAATLGRLAAIEPVRAVEFLSALISYGMPELAADVVRRAKAQSAEVDDTIVASILKALARQAKAAQEMSEAVKAARLWSALLSLDAENAAAKSGVRKIIKALLDQAREAGDGENFDEAYRKLKEATEIDPSDMRLWRELAKAAAAIGLWLEAAEAWLRFDILTGSSLETVRRACKLAHKDSAVDRALGLFLEGRRRYPDDAQIGEWGDGLVRKVITAAKEAIEQGRLEDAACMADLVASWTNNGPAAEGIMNRVKNALSARFKEAKAAGGPEAIQAAERLIAVSPTRSDAINLLAEHFYEQKKYQVAAEYYNVLTLQDPAKERHWLRLMRCHAICRDYESGIPIALKFLEKYPDSVPARRILGEMLQQLNARPD